MNPMPNTGRIWLVFVGLTLVGLGVFGRIVYIQTVEHDRWASRGEEFSTSVRTIEPARGQILSRDGSLLATSVPVYDLRWDSKCEGMNWEMYRAQIDTLCLALASATGKRPSDIRAKFDNARQRGHRGALIGRNIPFTDYQELRNLPFVKLGRYKSGLVFERRENRRRPFGKLAARTVGIDREQQRVGIERAWNDELAGVEGQQLSRKVAGNQWMPVTDEYLVDPVEGLDVVTTLDLHLQDVATNALEQQLRRHDAAWGTVIVCEVATGNIRAIANLTRHEVSEGKVEYWEDFNHAIGTAVEPGSTFKLASLMACMEGGMLPTDSVDTGNGEIFFFKKRMTDSNHKDGGHGSIPLTKVFEVSSNVGSALAVRNTFGEKPQAFLDELKRIGVAEKTGIRYVGEADPKVKTSVDEASWTGISLTQMAIGYEVTQTPLQTLALYNAIANNGRMMRPQLVTELRSGGEVMKTYEPYILNARVCNEPTLAACKRMMEAVCDPEGEGTAQNLFAGKPYTVAGKTGTARIATGNGYAEGRYRASFAGYFPADNPQYSCVVVIADTKSGRYYGSTIAAPVFREVADLIYATDPAFHTLSKGPLAELPSVPASNDGAREALETLYGALGMSFSTGVTSDWVKVKTGDKEAELLPLEIPESGVPDVRGMGLRDALYLLENAGLRVDYDGIGTVKSQSIAPGTPLRTELTTIQLRLS
ncbi:MAG: penicillin-binding protein [Flavobacteriales bacterium]